MIHTVRFLQKLSTIDDVTKYRGIPVSRYFLRRYIIVRYFLIPRIPTGFCTCDIVLSSFSVDSSLSPSVTASLFYFCLKIHLFHRSFPSIGCCFSSFPCFILFVVSMQLIKLVTIDLQQMLIFATWVTSLSWLDDVIVKPWSHIRQSHSC